ncbi:MAG: hypothetical protein IKH69_10130 [Bacteroidaceae bacterium]|nr:hypothetical protein [Bacteroidaceae bacterium]
MNKDKALEELFLTNTPYFDDREAFMASLTQRLDAVEYIKQQQDATLKHYKMSMVAAFLVGILSGVFTMFFILSTPAEVPLFKFDVQTGVLLWLTENSRLITATSLALLISFGLISIINNVQEIMNMRLNMQK